MVLRIQDGDYELRYEFQENGNCRITEFKEQLPQRIVPNVPPWTAYQNFSRVISGKLTLKLEELDWEDANLPRN